VAGGLDVHLNTALCLLNGDRIISWMNHGIMPRNLSHTNTELLPLAVAAIVLIFFSSMQNSIPLCNISLVLFQ
jgi:hypothetical protein